MTHRIHPWNTGSVTDIKGFSLLAYTFFALIVSGPAIIFAQLLLWVVHGGWHDWSTSLLLNVIKDDFSQISWAGLGKFLAWIGELPIWLILPLIGASGICILFGAADWIDQRHG